MSPNDAARVVRLVVDAVTDAFGVSPHQTNVQDFGARYDVQVTVTEKCCVPDLKRFATRLGAFDVVLEFDPGFNYDSCSRSGELQLTIRGIQVKP